MKPDQYEVSREGRHRLLGVVSPRGSSGLSPLFAFLFGLPFVGVGTFIALIATGAVSSYPRDIHAPVWVITCAGAVFGGAGLFLWGLAAFEAVERSRRKRATRDRPGMLAMQDYHWNTQGCRVSEWANALKALAFAAAISVFLSMFNWWAYFEDGPWPVKIIVGLFDFIAVCLWYHFFVSLGRALKFGNSEVIYTRFPYSAPGPVTLRWKSHRGVQTIQQGTFTLRCVEQWTERNGKNDSATTVQEVIWSAAWVVSKPRTFPLGETMDLSYTLPDDAPSTLMHADRPIFWELDVNLKLPGLDFKANYLVPVYVAAKAVAPSTPRLTEI